MLPAVLGSATVPLDGQAASSYLLALVMARRYLIRARTEFSAAHVLHGYAGACNRVHGHNFKVEVEAEASNLDEIGMAIDFTELERLAVSVTAELDHRLLNEVAPFNEVNPTAENVAAYVYQRIERALPTVPRGDAVRLRSVTVSENDRSSVTYTEDPTV